MTAFDPTANRDAPSLFRYQTLELLGRARASLARLARTSDATKAEIDHAQAAHDEAQHAVAGARALFDVITAHRAGVIHSLPENFDEAAFVALSTRRDVISTVSELAPVHFPAAFPEVFLRDRPGFDCLLGNPPWEKVMVEKKIWWGQFAPGVRSRNEKDMNDSIAELRRSRPDLEPIYQSEINRNNRTRAVLMAGPYPGIGKSHPDLYKAFAWRNWHLIRPETGLCRSGTTPNSVRRCWYGFLATRCDGSGCAGVDDLAQQGTLGIRRGPPAISDLPGGNRSLPTTRSNGHIERAVSRP